MTQEELNREIANVTGESPALIAALGFSLLPEPPLIVVDHRVRLGDLTRQRMRQRLKAREAPARKPRPAAPSDGGNEPTRRTAA